MIFELDLTKGQYKFFASAVKTIAEGIILGASAAFFLPETLQLEEPISFTRYALLSIGALIILLIGSILERKGEKND